MIANRPVRDAATAADLLAMAESVMARARPETAGLWPRAAALLARQALEAALDEFWRERGLALDACPTRAQLLCLREYLPKERAGEVYEAWAVLTRACHHHAYEVAPTVWELGVVTATVRKLSTHPSGAPMP